MLVMKNECVTWYSVALIPLRQKDENFPNGYVFWMMDWVLVTCSLIYILMKLSLKNHYKKDNAADYSTGSGIIVISHIIFVQNM